MIQCPSNAKAIETKRSSYAFEEYSKKKRSFLTLGWQHEKVLPEHWPAAPVVLHGAQRGHSHHLSVPQQTYPAVNYRVILPSQMALWWQPPLSKIITHPGSSCAHPAHLTRSALSQIFHMKPAASATEIVIVTPRFLQLGIRCSRHQVAISLQD